MNFWEIKQGDVIEVLKSLPSESVHCVVTSPPYYGLRDYGMNEQIGLEKTPEAYIDKMVAVFREVRRVLRSDGVCYVNLGDSYANDSKWGGSTSGKHVKPLHGSPVGRGKRHTGLKPKDLIGIPWMFAFAARADGWFLRQDIVWHKPSPMPESVRDRCTKAHEYIFLLTKSAKYFYDSEAIKEPVSGNAHSRGNGVNPKASMNAPGCRQNGSFSSAVNGLVATRNKRSVWTIATAGYKGAHFATFPEKLVEPCILSGTSEEGCCPLCGTPWSRIVSRARKPTRPALDSKVAGLGSDVVGNRDPQRHVTVTETVGWVPGCKCDAGEPVPCTVLDPFAGSGTTVAVAKRLGRNGIGIELNPEYVKLAQARINKVCDPSSGRLFA